MSNNLSQNELHISVWKQRLFEAGIIVIIAIITIEIFTDEVPLYIQVIFVALAIISILIQHRKSFCFMRISSNNIELYSPKLVGRKYRYPLSSIERIEEIDGIYTTMRILLKSGREDRIVLERFLGVCYSLVLVKELRKMLRSHGIEFEIRTA